MTEASRLNQNKEDFPPGMTLLHTLRGHTSSLNSVAWSPDGELLASGAADKTLRLWSPTTSALLDGHTSSINFVAWSPNSKVLASSSKDSTVRLWNPTTIASLHTLEGHTADVKSLAWSPDGELLASGSDDATVRVWNSTTGKLLRTLKGHTRGIRAVAWSSDGQFIASGSDDMTMRVWSSTTGKCVQSFDDSDSNFGSKVRSVAWAPNSDVLASGHDDLTTWVRRTDIQLPGDQTHQLEGEALTRAVSAVAWSPDGKLLVSGGVQSSVRVWNPTTGRLEHYLEGHTGEVISVVWSPDGKLLVTSSSTSPHLDNAEIYIWRTDTWEPLAALKDLKDCINVSWHPRFSILATAGYQTGDIFVWHFDLVRLFHMAPSPETVHYTNAKVVLVGDSGVGKSGLALVLTKQPFAPTDSTHGRHVWLLDRQEVQEKERPHEMRDIWLWDLAGQPDYRLIHQLHLHEATVALIVFDATRDTDTFSGIRHWHRALRHAQQARGPAALPLTIFLVSARIDRGSLSVSRIRLNMLVQELGCADYIETSAKDGRGIPELSQAISGAIHWADLPRITSTQLLQAIKLFVLSEQQTLLSQKARSHFSCPVCQTDISLLDGTDRLASSISSQIHQMEQTADGERNRESVATIRQGKVAVQEANRPHLSPTNKAAQQINMYISSSSTSQDERLLEELERQLSVVRRQPKLYLWEKRLIAPGANWEQEISTYVNQAHLILFLVSPDFFASDQCYEEMELAIRRVKAREVSVIPLLMRHTANWQDTPLGMLEPLPADRRPISDRADRERAMSDIAQHIRQIIEKRREELANSGE